MNIKDCHGIKTYEEITSLYPESAIVILSGMNDEAIALDIVKKGAQDYLLKSDVSSKILSKTIEYSKERKNLIHQLKASELKYRNVFNQSPLPMFIINGENQIMQTNQAALELYGCDEQQLTSKKLTELSISDRVWLSKSEHAFQVTCMHKGRNDKRIKVEIFGRRLYEESDDFICLLIDKSAEWEFEQTKYKVISGAQENERKKIAMDLHDGLVQNLAVLSLWFNNLEIPEEQKQIKDQIAKQIENVIREARGIAYTLSPPDLDEGFIHALDILKERINRIGDMKLNLKVEDGVQEFDFGKVDKYNLYRIIQEFLNNSIKHSGSDHSDIHITKEGECIKIHANDYGKGFDIANHSIGLGIKSLEHRIKLGNLKGGVTSAVGSGTQLNIEIEQ